VKALRELEAKGRAGDGDAWATLGMHLRDGVRDRRGRLRVRPNPKRALACFERAAALGDAGGLMALANERSRRGKFRESLALNRRAARLGEQTALFNAAIDLRRLGRHRDAVKVLRRLATDGDDSALFEVAKAELLGVGTRRNPKLALEHLELVVEARRDRYPTTEGERELAMLRIAETFLDGLLVPFDYPRARRWLERAAKEGSTVARETLRDLDL
jgi:TPR repeat protein